MTQPGEGNHCNHVSHQDIKCDICPALKAENERLTKKANLLDRGYDYYQLVKENAKLRAQRKFILEENLSGMINGVFTLATDEQIQNSIKNLDAENWDEE